MKEFCADAMEASDAMSVVACLNMGDPLWVDFGSSVPGGGGGCKEFLEVLW